MAKISKPAAAKHEEAIALVKSGGNLDYDQRWFVAGNFRENANHLNGKAGAFFTPTALANDFCMGVNYGDGLSRIVDLCAGIGKLSLPIYERLSDKTRLTLVESNPDYVAVGRKIMPEATWICADVMDTQQWWDGLLFDLAIANPPFGAIGCKPHAMSLFRNKSLFEFNVVELAAMIAKDAAFILPQRSVPFQYSGKNGMQEQDNPRFNQFHSKTGIGLEILISVDTSDYIDDWNGVSPLVELVSFPEEEHQHFYHNPRFEASHAEKPGSDETRQR